jgi:hypothetical protein
MLCTLKGTVTRKNAVASNPNTRRSSAERTSERKRVGTAPVKIARPIHFTPQKWEKAELREVVEQEEEEEDRATARGCRKEEGEPNKWRLEETRQGSRLPPCRTFPLGKLHPYFLAHTEVKGIMALSKFSIREWRGAHMLGCAQIQ